MYAWPSIRRYIVEPLGGSSVDVFAFAFGSTAFGRPLDLRRLYGTDLVEDNAPERPFTLDEYELGIGVGFPGNTVEAWLHWTNVRQVTKRAVAMDVPETCSTGARSLNHSNYCCLTPGSQTQRPESRHRRV